MKITNISLENFLGGSHIELAFSQRIALIAGKNGAGKSTVREAIKLAFLESAERVDHKKEYPLMVTDGAKRGQIVVTTEQGDIVMSLPDGKVSGDAQAPQHAALAYLLDPQLFAQSTADARRTFLFGLTKTSANKDDIVRRLMERGCDKARVDAVLPMLRGGFPAGCDFAKEEAKNAKTSWRTTTGETWGSNKAEGWTAPLAKFDADALAQTQFKATALDSDIAAGQKALGALEAKAQAYAQHQKQHGDRQQKAAKLPALRDKLKKDEMEWHEWVGKVTDLEARAGTAPRTGLVHDLARSLHYFLTFDDIDTDVPEDKAAVDVMDAYIAQYGKIGGEGDAEAAAALPDAIKARDLMARSVENDRRDIAEAEAAAVARGPDVEKVASQDVEVARQRIARYRVERQELSKELQVLQDAQRAAQQADQVTQKAAGFHADVMAWGKIADALAPDGIPAELLEEALAPVNALLGALAVGAGWMLPRIDADISITADGRPYRLLSESEKWRTDALLALAIAQLSGLRFVALDRFDVLDLQGRADLFDLLDQLAEDGEIDTALVFGTLKSAPAAPTPACSVHWIENGTTDAQLRAAA